MPYKINTNGLINAFISQENHIPTIEADFPYKSYTDIILDENAIYSYSTIDEIKISDPSREMPTININIEYNKTINDKGIVIGNDLEVPDLMFIYFIYSNRLSLVRINPNYPKEKIIEYFDDCIESLSNIEIVKDRVDYQVYLYLVTQYQMLGIPNIPKFLSFEPIDNIVEINTLMINKIYDKLNRL